MSKWDRYYEWDDGEKVEIFDCSDWGKDQELCQQLHAMMEDLGWYVAAREMSDDYMAEYAYQVRDAAGNYIGYYQWIDPVWQCRELIQEAWHKKMEAAS